jgi:hypothetical protein
VSETAPTPIHWVLTPAPQIGRLAWEAVSSCVHGQRAHVLFGRPQTIQETAGELGPSHRQHTGCHCPMGAVTLTDQKGGTTYG